MKSKKNPLRRDPEKTQAGILDQAVRCFAHSGYHGVGLNEICEKARVNKRMIYHYFESKEGLYLAVHRRGWQELEDWFLRELARSEKRNLSLSESGSLLLEAVEIFHDFIVSHQIFVRLLMWDGLEGGMASRKLWKEVRGPIYRQLEGLIRAAQESGAISSDLKASHLIISFMGAIAFYFSHAHTMGDIFQKNPLSAEAIAERKQQIMALFQKLMAPPLKSGERAWKANR